VSASARARARISRRFRADIHGLVEEPPDPPECGAGRPRRVPATAQPPAFVGKRDPLRRPAAGARLGMLRPRIARAGVPSPPEAANIHHSVNRVETFTGP
jgi:hypothetical protein